MRELERDHANTSSAAPALQGRLAIVGTGRVGGSIATAARAAGLDVVAGSRQLEPSGASIVLLCVPDHAISDVCSNLAPSLPAGTLVGHVSGATRLDALSPAVDLGCKAFSLHPLQTIPTGQTDLAGAPCAIAAASAEALEAVRVLAERLGMVPFAVPEAGRAAYHAAASMASNFLIALEESAAQLMGSAGVENPRSVLTPLVLRTAANWTDSGAGALTGPIARGDEATVALHLEALAERAPELRPMYEAMAARTRELGSAR